MRVTLGVSKGYNGRIFIVSGDSVGHMLLTKELLHVKEQRTSILKTLCRFRRVWDVLRRFTKSFVKTSPSLASVEQRSRKDRTPEEGRRTGTPDQT